MTVIATALIASAALNVCLLFKLKRSRKASQTLASGASFHPAEIGISGYHQSLHSAVAATPDALFNVIKQALPRDQGLIYELEAFRHTETNKHEGRRYPAKFFGQDTVSVVITEAVSGDEVGGLRFCEKEEVNGSLFTTYNDRVELFQQQVVKKVFAALLKKRQDDFSGYKEIVS